MHRDDHVGRQPLELDYDTIFMILRRSNGAMIARSASDRSLP
jgi:hypothetical protein